MSRRGGLRCRRRIWPQRRVSVCVRTAAWTDHEKCSLADSSCQVADCGIVDLSGLCALYPCACGAATCPASETYALADNSCQAPEITVAPTPAGATVAPGPKEETQSSNASVKYVGVWQCQGSIGRSYGEYAIDIEEEDECLVIILSFAAVPVVRGAQITDVASNRCFIEVDDGIDPTDHEVAQGWGNAERASTGNREVASAVEDPEWKCWKAVQAPMSNSTPAPLPGSTPAPIPAEETPAPAEPAESTTMLAVTGN